MKYNMMVYKKCFLYMYTNELVRECQERIVQKNLKRVCEKLVSASV
jgi:hypothetical protein